MTDSFKLEKPQAPLLLFDIETVPDFPLLFQTAQKDFVSNKNFDVRVHWNDYSFFEHFEKQKIFPQTLYHCVLSICAVYVDPQTYRIMDGFRHTIPKASSYEEFRHYEKDLLEKFWLFSVKYQDFHKQWHDQIVFQSSMSEYQKNKFKKLPVTFCGYNISGFDLPVIEQRSLMYFLTCPLEDYGKNLGPNSYRYKYAHDKIFDLLNFVCNYDNKNARMSLDALARSLGLSGKMEEMDGSCVAKEYYCLEGSDKIEEYCAIDVLISYAVLLVVQKFRGILDREKFKECVLWFENWLMKDGKSLNYKKLAQKSQDFFNNVKKI